MKTTLYNIEQGFINWYTHEIATMNWKMLLSAPLVQIIFNNFKNQNAGLFSMLTDSEGLIDVEMLHKEYSAILNSKGNVEIAGVIFTTKDLDTLVGYIKNTVVVSTPIAPVINNPSSIGGGS